MDKIYLKNIEIFANHGVFQEEKILGQKFILSLELSLDFHKAAKDGDLSASVHYGELCHNVEKVFKEEVCDLLETLVYKVGAYVLDTYEVVKEVKISLKKPWAPISRHLDYAAVETTIARHKAYIALGSNIGNKEQYIRSAIEKINELEGTKVKKESKLLVTKPWGKEDQEDFLNAVIEVETYLKPKELMAELLRVESILERKREIKWGPRSIDLDIILFDDLVSNDEFVVLPHPLMHLREFVLEPLCEIAPYAIHPLKNKRAFELLEEIKSIEN